MARAKFFLAKKPKMDTEINETATEQPTEQPESPVVEPEGEGEFVTVEDAPKSDEPEGQACETCEGSGLINDKRKRCPECGGTGVK